MSSRAKRYLPTKIESNSTFDRTNPAHFDSIIRDSFDLSRKISQKRVSQFAAEKHLPGAYRGAIEKYRRQVLKRSTSDILKRFADDNHGMTSKQIALSWIELNAPLTCYTRLEQRYHVLFAAAIWILDRITEQDDWRKKLYPLLPRDDHEVEEFFEPDVWDCSLDYDLIMSVVHVLYYRNLTVPGGSASVDAKKGEKSRWNAEYPNADSFCERVELFENNPHVLTSEYAISHGLDPDWRNTSEADSNRERFRQLISLVPEDDIEEAVLEFGRLWKDWVDVFFEGVFAINIDSASLSEQKKRIADEHNKTVDELEALIDRFENKKRAQQVRSEKKSKSANPLLMKPQQIPSPAELLQGHSVHLGNIAQTSVPSHTGFSDLDADFREMERLYKRCEALGDQFDKLVDESDALYRKERMFSYQMATFGRISNGYEEYVSGLPAKVSEPLRTLNCDGGSGAYGICFGCCI